MRLKYPKEFIKPDGRKLIAGGPRDLQQRQRMRPSVEPTDTVIEELASQIRSIKVELKKRKPSGYFSADEVDKEIRKAVKQAITESTPSLQKYKLRVDELQKKNDLLRDRVKEIEEDDRDVGVFKKEISMLKQAILDKEEIIESLKTISTVVDNNEIINMKRPQMEQKFIDPLEKGAGHGLESHINIKNISHDEKENMFDKVDKLKRLIGNLPKEEI